MSEPKEDSDEWWIAGAKANSSSTFAMVLAERLEARNREIAELKSELKTFLPDVFHDWINAEETECYADCRLCYLNVLVGDEK